MIAAADVVNEQTVPPEFAVQKRKPWTPKAKHHAIYRAAKIDCRTQIDIAIEFAVDQSTVSRIVKRYEAWHARAKPAERAAAGELPAAESKRLAHWLATERQEAIYRTSMRLAASAEAPVVTTREGFRGETHYKDTTTREQPGLPARFLRQASQAADRLWKLAECAPPPPVEQHVLDDHQVFVRLMEIREEAEEAGLVPKSQQVYWAVEMWLRALKGKEQPLSTEKDFAPGSMRAEFARAIMSGGEQFGVSPAAVLRELAEDCERAERGQETGDRGQEPGAGVCSSSSSPSSSSSSSSSPSPSSSTLLGAGLPTPPTGRPQVSSSAGRPAVESCARSGDPRTALHGQVINLPYGEMHNCITDDASATSGAAAPYAPTPRPPRMFLNDEICDHRHGPEPTEEENMERLKARKRRERAIKICPVAGP